MKKSYNVKNVTFIFNDEVKFKEKTFNYNAETYRDPEVSKEFTDNIENYDQRLRNIVAYLIGISLICFALVIMLPKFGINSSAVTITMLGLFLLSFFAGFILSYKIRVIDAADISKFYDETAPIEFIVSCVLDVEQIKEFEIITDGEGPVLRVEYEDSTDMISSYEDCFKEYDFDMRHYKKHGPIEINMIEKTIKGVEE